MNDVERMLILNMVEDLGSIRTQNLLEHFGSLDKIFKAKKSEFEKVDDIGPVIAPRVVESIKKMDIREELRLIEKCGVRVLTFLDENYPKSLKNIYDPPVVLYVRGEILPEDDVAIAIVGSRLASFYGLQTAERLGFQLASHGVTVVSGLARGIDSSAHKGALKAKGRTIAVLGSGLMNIYPSEHKKLADEISKSGAVISEFPMRMIPDKGNFPRRNRIISGLSRGVVIVEAAERSGALITANFALEQGKDVFAVPGKVDSLTSRGTHGLIKEGAKLVGGVEDILEELDLAHCVGGTQISHLRSGQGRGGLDKEEDLVYNLLSSEPKYIDELAEESNLSIPEISKILFNLEIKKFVRELPGKNFVKL